MKHVIYAVTHGKKAEGPNPGLTPEGYEAIKNLAGKLLLATQGAVVNIIVGTGRRFLDVFRALGLKELTSNVKYCFLLGSADSGVKTETGWDVIGADGTVFEAKFVVGLIGTPGINLWEYVRALPDGAILCTGREFIGALGEKDAESAVIYRINTVTRAITKVG